MANAKVLKSEQHWLVKGDGVNAGGGQQVYFATSAEIVNALEHGGFVTNYNKQARISIAACGDIKPVQYHTHAQCLFVERFLMKVCQTNPLFFYL